MFSTARGQQPAQAPGNNRTQAPGNNRTGNSRQSLCVHCRQPGHSSNECPQQVPQPQGRRSGRSSNELPRQPPEPRGRRGGRGGHRSISTGITLSWNTIRLK